MSRQVVSRMLKLIIILGLIMVSAIVGITPLEPDTSAQISDNEIADPEPFDWTFVNNPEPHYVGVMEYGEATFNINDETLTTRAYRQEGGHLFHPRPDPEHGAG